MYRKKILTVVLIVLAVLSAGYGICILAVNSGTGFFAVWLLLAVLMLVLSAVFRKGLFPAAVRKIIAILVLIAVVYTAGTWVCVLTGFHAEGEKNLDEIIVLGAQVKEDGPSTVLRERLDTAYDYLRKNPDTICVVSGGQGANEPEAEGDAMRDYLIKRGISGDRVISENRSLDTSQNLENSGKLISTGSDRVGIVTNNFHVFRAVRIAKNAGYAHVCGIAAPSVPFYLPNNMLRETFGITKDLFAGNLI